MPYLKKSLREASLLLVGFLYSIPVILVLSMSLKAPSGAFDGPFQFTQPPTLDNYSQAWSEAGTGGFGPALLTSTTITAGSLVCLLFVASWCGYQLARRLGRASRFIYFVFVIGILLPLQLSLIPIFIALRGLGIANTYLGMILLYTGLMMPFAVFLYTGFIRALPREYEEAARVDGASHWQIYRRVLFPLIRPVSITIAILAGIVIWNDFYTPLIFLFGSGRETLPLAIFSFVGEHSSAWPLVMASVALSAAPVVFVYLIAQKRIIESFAGGVRG